MKAFSYIFRIISYKYSEAKIIKIRSKTTVNFDIVEVKILNKWIRTLDN